MVLQETRGISPPIGVDLDGARPDFVVEARKDSSGQILVKLGNWYEFPPELADALWHSSTGLLATHRAYQAEIVKNSIVGARTKESLLLAYNRTVAILMQTYAFQIDSGNPINIDQILQGKVDVGSEQITIEELFDRTGDSLRSPLSLNDFSQKSDIPQFTLRKELRAVAVVTPVQQRMLAEQKWRDNIAKPDLISFMGIRCRLEAVELLRAKTVEEFCNYYHVSQVLLDYAYQQVRSGVAISQTYRTYLRVKEKGQRSIVAVLPLSVEWELAAVLANDVNLRPLITSGAYLSLEQVAAAMQIQPAILAAIEKQTEEMPIENSLVLTINGVTYLQRQFGIDWLASQIESLSRAGDSKPTLVARLKPEIPANALADDMVPIADLGAVFGVGNHMVYHAALALIDQGVIAADSLTSVGYGRGKRRFLQAQTVDDIRQWLIENGKITDEGEQFLTDYIRPMGLDVRQRRNLERALSTMSAPATGVEKRYRRWVVVDLAAFEQYLQSHPGLIQSCKGRKKEDEKDQAVDLYCSDPLAQYMREIGRYRLLNRTDERNLSEMMHDGKQAKRLLEQKNSYSTEEKAHLQRAIERGKRAEDRLIKCNLRLVVFIAKKYYGRGIPFFDLIQTGNLGLIHALQKFDPQRGCRISTYATYWIRQYMIRYIDNHRRVIRHPVYLAERKNARLQAVGKLTKILGRDPYPKEIWQEMGLDQRRYQKLMRAIKQQELSLDTPLGEDQARYLKDFVADPTTSVDFVRVILENDRKAVVHSLIMALVNDGTLTAREAKIIDLRHGLGIFQPQNRGISMTLQEIGTLFNLSRERIRQIEKQALVKLQQPDSARLIRDYL